MSIQYIDRKTGEKITEKPPAEVMLKFLYNNPAGKYGLLPLVRKKFLSEWYGRQMDKPTSVNKIKQFVQDLDIDMSESKKTIDEFTSFNEFFYRELKPGARPIQNGFVSPGDGKLLAFERVSDINQFFVKGQPFTLKKFLVDDNLIQKYKDASLLLLRLAPNDYHRFHFPYAGLPTKEMNIKGKYYSVSPYALAKNFTTVFCENKRSIVELKTADKSDVALVPVGATMVGSIIMTYLSGQVVKKGDEFGYFAFGGSSIVILVDSKHITIDPDLLENTRNSIETAVQMGEKIGM